MLGLLLVLSYLIQDRRHDFVKHHVLVGSRREDLVELVRLVAERTRPHRQVYSRALDAVRRHHHAAVFAYFAVIAPSTPDDNVDIGLVSFIRLEFPLLPLKG